MKRDIKNKADSDKLLQEKDKFNMKRKNGKINFAFMPGVHWGWKIGLILLPIVVSVISLCVGRIQISIFDVFSSIWANIFGGEKLSPNIEGALWNLRLPRILLSLFVGMGLSVAGTAYQSLFSNPLATPDTLGVASGSCFGAVLAILLGASMAVTQLFSFVTGIVAVVLTVLAASGKQSGLGKIVLSGIMIGSLFTALVSLVEINADTEEQLPEIMYWLMGGMEGAEYSSLLVGGTVIIVGVVILFLLRWRLNLLPLSEEEARASGVNVKALRIVTVLCATAITASSVAMCGQVGWVGLLVPHMCRMKFGNNHMTLLPASMCVGSAFLVIVDTLARSISPTEIPISILTAAIGAPFFIFLMRKSKGWQL